MEQLDQRLLAALREAANDLEITLVAPYDTTRENGEAVCIEGYFPHFGDGQGIAFVSFSRRLKLGSLVVPMAICPKEYRKYDRKRYISALSDFGWRGNGTPPVWLNSN